MVVGGGNVRWVENMYVDCGNWITSAAMITVPMYMCGDCRRVHVKWLKSKELPLFDLYCRVHMGMEGSVRGKH